MISDFDDTIVTPDVGQYILLEFAQGNWRLFDEQLERGEITLEECMRRQFSLVRGTEEEILTRVLPVIKWRPGFRQFADYCHRMNIALTIASAGIDFCIRELLQRQGMADISLHAPRAIVTEKGIELEFPRLRFSKSANMKEDLVRLCRDQGRMVAFIGDGVTDFPAARIADLAFAVTGSRLAELCLSHGVPHQKFDAFSEVSDALKNVTSVS